MKMFIKSILLGLLLSCNIYEWTEDKEDRFHLAEDAYRNGHYDEALQIANAELANDSLNSDFIYIKIKSLLKIFYTDNNQVASLEAFSILEQALDLADKNEDVIPFYRTIRNPFTNAKLTNLDSLTALNLDRSIKTLELNNLYQVILLMKKIYRNETHGEFKSNYIKTDLATLLTLHGLVKIRDTNRDLLINDADYIFSFSGKKNASQGVYDAIFPKIPQNVMMTENLSNIDSILKVKTYMDSHGITLNKSEDTFHPEENDPQYNPAHKVFFDLHIYHRLIPSVKKLIDDIEDIRITLTSVINEGNTSLPKGELIESMDIVETSLGHDQAFRDLKSFIISTRDQFKTFNKSSVEKELWDNYIKKEMKLVIDNL